MTALLCGARPRRSHGQMRLLAAQSTEAEGQSTEAEGHLNEDGYSKVECLDAGRGRLWGFLHDPPKQCTKQMQE
jgi:hypothetical protein